MDQTNIIIDYLKKRNTFFVDYDDFRSDPKKIINKIGEFMGCIIEPYQYKIINESKIINYGSIKKLKKLYNDVDNLPCSQSFKNVLRKLR
jgi:hypothetical protein